MLNEQLKSAGRMKNDLNGAPSLKTVQERTVIEMTRLFTLEICGGQICEATDSPRVFCASNFEDSAEKTVHESTEMRKWIFMSSKDALWYQWTWQGVR